MHDAGCGCTTGGDAPLLRVGFVSYGGVSAATRSVQMTKQVVTMLKMMPMLEAVSMPMRTQFVHKETGAFDPGKVQEDASRVMLDELLRWTEALRVLRRPR